MSNAARPIAVFGAAGAQGGPVARALLDAGRPVRAIVRDPARAAALAERGAEVVVADLADATALRQALTGVVGAFVHLPVILIDAVVRAQAGAVAAALQAAEVPLTVFTLSGVAPATPVGMASFDTKAIARRILSGAGVPLVGLEPSGYLGNLSAPFSAPGVVYHDELRYPLPAGHRQPWISTEDQAALAIAALARPDLAGRWFRIGEQLTGPELAAGIGEARGRQVRYVPLEPEAFGRALAPFIGEEIAAAVAADYGMLSGNPPSLALDSDTTALRRALGIPATAVAAWASTQDWDAAAAMGGPA